MAEWLLKQAHKLDKTNIKVKAPNHYLKFALQFDYYNKHYIMGCASTGSRS